MSAWPCSSFAFLQGDGVDDGFPLEALQPGQNHLPVGRVYHEGDAGDVGLGGQQVEEVDHLGAGIQQPVVHVDVDDLRPVFHLLAGNLQGFFVFLLVNQAEELARAGHVAAFAHVDKVAFGADFQQVEAGEPQGSGLRCGDMGRDALGQRREAGDVFVRRAAAAAQDVHQAFVQVFLHLGGHLVGRLVVLAQAVGQAGVGIDADVIGGAGGQLAEEGLQLAGAEGAVEADGEDVGVLHGGQEGVEGLAGEGAPGAV